MPNCRPAPLVGFALCYSYVAARILKKNKTNPNFTQTTHLPRPATIRYAKQHSLPPLPPLRASIPSRHRACIRPKRTQTPLPCRAPIPLFGEILKFPIEPTKPLFFPRKDQNDRTHAARPQATQSHSPSSIFHSPSPLGALEPCRSSPLPSRQAHGFSRGKIKPKIKPTQTWTSPRMVGAPNERDNAR